MKCQILPFEKYLRKNIISLSSVESAQRAVKVKMDIAKKHVSETRAESLF